MFFASCFLIMVWQADRRQPCSGSFPHSAARGRGHRREVGRGCSRPMRLYKRGAMVLLCNSVLLPPHPHHHYYLHHHRHHPSLLLLLLLLEASPTASLRRGHPGCGALLLGTARLPAAGAAAGYCWLLLLLFGTSPVPCRLTRLPQVGSGVPCRLTRLPQVGPGVSRAATRPAAARRAADSAPGGVQPPRPRAPVQGARALQWRERYACAL